MKTIKNIVVTVALLVTCVPAMAQETVSCVPGTEGKYAVCGTDMHLSGELEKYWVITNNDALGKIKVQLSLFGYFMNETETLANGIVVTTFRGPLDLWITSEYRNGSLVSQQINYKERANSCGIT